MKYHFINCNISSPKVTIPYSEWISETSEALLKKVLNVDRFNICGTRYSGSIQKPLINSKNCSCEIMEKLSGD